MKKSNAEKRNSFCEGFAYGTRYGYEKKLHGRMKDKEISSTWILAESLYNELKEEDEKNKTCQSKNI